MREVVAAGIDMVGIARPMAFVPDYPARILADGTEPALPNGPCALGYRPLDGYLQLSSHNHQFHRMAAGLDPQGKTGIGTVIKALTRTGVAGATQISVPRSRH